MRESCAECSCLEIQQPCEACPLRRALERIAKHEWRADRRHSGMVDVEEVKSLVRIAEEAVRNPG